MSFINQRVKTIVEKVGQDITYRKITRTYNTSTGENAETTVDYSVKGFIRKYTPQELSGGLVQQIDRELRIAKNSATRFTPKENDEVLINTKIYTVMAAESLNAKNEDAIYVLRIRGNDN